MLRMRPELRDRDHSCVIVDEVSFAPVPDVIFAVSRAASGVTLLGDFLQNGPIAPEELGDSDDDTVRRWYFRDSFGHRPRPALRLNLPARRLALDAGRLFGSLASSAPTAAPTGTASQTSTAPGATGAPPSLTIQEPATSRSTDQALDAHPESILHGRNPLFNPYFCHGTQH
jgi:hypothetical protein